MEIANDESTKMLALHALKLSFTLSVCFIRKVCFSHSHSIVFPKLGRRLVYLQVLHFSINIFVLTFHIYSQ